MKRFFIVAIMCLIGTIAMNQELPSFDKIKSSFTLPEIVQSNEWLIDSTNNYLFEGSNDSSLLFRVFYEYNDWGKLVCDSNLVFYLAQQEWLLYEKNSYVYDSEMRLVEKIYYLNVPSYGWVPNQKFNYFYHEGDTLIKHKIKYYFEEEVSLWRKRDSIAFKRNDLMQIDTVFRYLWDDDYSIYQASKFTIYVYNDEGSITSDTTYTYQEKAEYVLNWLRTYSYNAQGLEYEYIASDWNEGLQAWSQFEKYIYEYSEDNLRNLARRHSWDDGIDDWYEYERYFYAYDELNNMEFLMNWELIEEVWQKSFTFKFFWSQYNIVHNPELSKIDRFEFYPNPVRGILNIICFQETEVFIVDLRGIRVKHIILQNGLQTIDCRDLKAGIYIISSIDGGIKKKLVVH